MPTANSKTWFVIADDPLAYAPAVVRRGLAECDARSIARELNKAAEHGSPRVLYFAELFETSSVVDTEHSQS